MYLKLALIYSHTQLIMFIYNIAAQSREANPRLSIRYTGQSSMKTPASARD